MEDAIRAQDIVWAAFPHNGELATVDASYLSFGVRIRLNVPDVAVECMLLLEKTSLLLFLILCVGTVG